MPTWDVETPDGKPLQIKTKTDAPQDIRATAEAAFRALGIAARDTVKAAADAGLPPTGGPPNPEAAMGAIGARVGPVVSTVAPMILPGAGAAAGGSVGFATGGPLGAVTGATTGATVGQGFNEVADYAATALQGGTQPPLTDRLKRVGEVGAMTGVTSALGPAGRWIGGLQPVEGAAAKLAAGQGIPTTWAERYPSVPGLQSGEAIAARSLLGRAQMQKFATGQASELNTRANSLAATLRGRPGAIDVAETNARFEALRNAAQTAADAQTSAQVAAQVAALKAETTSLAETLRGRPGAIDVVDTNNRFYAAAREHYKAARKTDKRLYDAALTSAKDAGVADVDVAGIFGARDVLTRSVTPDSAAVRAVNNWETRFAPSAEDAAVAAQRAATARSVEMLQTQLQRMEGAAAPNAQSVAGVRNQLAEAQHELAAMPPASAPRTPTLDETRELSDALRPMVRSQDKVAAGHAKALLTAIENADEAAVARHAPSAALLARADAHYRNVTAKLRDGDFGPLFAPNPTLGGPTLAGVSAKLYDPRDPSFLVDALKVASPAMRAEMQAQYANSRLGNLAGDGTPVDPQKVAAQLQLDKPIIALLFRGNARRAVQSFTWAATSPAAAAVSVPPIFKGQTLSSMSSQLFDAANPSFLADALKAGPRVKQVIQEQYVNTRFENLYHRSVDGKASFDSAAFAKQIETDAPVLDQLFGNDKRRALQEFAAVANLTKATQARTSDLLGLFVTGGQVTSALGAIAMGHPMTAIPALGLPAVFAKLATSPKFVYALTSILRGAHTVSVPTAAALTNLVTQQEPGAPGGPPLPQAPR